MLPGPSFEDTQQIAMGGQQRRRGPADTKVVLVFYVGGVTMAEVAALRWLSSRWLTSWWWLTFINTTPR